MSANDVNDPERLVSSPAPPGGLGVRRLSDDGLADGSPGLPDPGLPDPGLPDPEDSLRRRAALGRALPGAGLGRYVLCGTPLIGLECLRHPLDLPRGQVESGRFAPPAGCRIADRCDRCSGFGRG